MKTSDKDLMMSPRIISLVQIAAIIACPMWCSSGLCLADQCCSLKQPAEQVCPAHRSAKCCCCNQESDRDDNRSPCRCHDKSCQGVCGGAVFQKPIEVSHTSDGFLPFLNDVDFSFRAQSAECQMLNLEHPPFFHSGNHGRFMRALHMSLLC